MVDLPGYDGFDFLHIDVLYTHQSQSLKRSSLLPRETAFHRVHEYV